MKLAREDGHLVWKRPGKGKSNSSSSSSSASNNRSRRLRVVSKRNWKKTKSGRKGGAEERSTATATAATTVAVERG